MKAMFETMESRTMFSSSLPQPTPHDAPPDPRLDRPAVNETVNPTNNAATGSQNQQARASVSTDIHTKVVQLSDISIAGGG